MYTVVEAKREMNGEFHGKKEFALNLPRNAVHHVKERYKAEVTRSLEDADKVIAMLERACENGQGKRAQLIWESYTQLRDLFVLYGVSPYLIPYSVEIVQEYFKAKMELVKEALKGL
jgi:hypothetical protein